ncbi:hypothetical protein ACKVMT_08250 [Halobacteriales archaeon Cl-PHB]
MSLDESTLETRGDGDGPRIEIAANRSVHDGIVYEIRVTSFGDVSSVWVMRDDARVQDRTGLESTSSPRRYRWDGETSTAGLTVSPTGGDSADGSLSLSGNGWTFAPVPDVTVAWRPSNGSEIRQVDPFAARDSATVHVRSDDGGLVGEEFAVVGRSTVHTRSTDSGAVRLVVPETVQPQAEPDAILDAFAAADARFEDAAGNETATVFVLPRSVRDGGATFVSSDETWINGGARLHTANNVWLHEYVHTRQSFELGPRMAWFGEASAEYYGGLLARDVGLVSTGSYRAYLSGRSRGATALTDREAWADDTLPYHRGVRVLAALDSQISDRTDGARSLEDVYARMNSHEGVISYPVFARLVSDVAGDDVEPWLDRHVAGTAAIDNLADPSDANSDSGLPIAPTMVGLTVLTGVLIRRHPAL